MNVPRTVGMPYGEMCLCGETCLRDGIRRVRHFRSSYMFYTCVGFFAMTFPFTRVRRDVFIIIGFDWQPRAAIGNERSNCYVVHNTILDRTCRQAASLATTTT